MTSNKKDIQFTKTEGWNGSYIREGWELKIPNGDADGLGIKNTFGTPDGDA